MSDEPPPSDRVRLRGGAARAEYDRAAILAILDAALIAHVGVITDDGPIVAALDGIQAHPFGDASQR